MKILIAIPCLLTGGTEIQTLNLVKALVAGGHEVVTACYFEHSPGMVENYRRAGSRVELMSPDGCRPQGVKKTVIFLYKKLRGIVRRYRPDVAHVQYMAPGAIPILLLRLLGVKRIVATAHTGADIYPSLRLLHFLVRHVLTAFQCITLRAEASFFGTAGMYVPGMRLRRHGNHFTIHNTLPDYIRVAETPRLSGGGLTVGVVSRLEAIKGMDLVVPAFAKVCREHPAVRLLVVGDGSQRTLMERQAEEAGVRDRVELVGRQPQCALQAYYDRIDILLMPSRSEGFGLTAIEGMARGCVVVAADTGGLPEVVTAEVGLLHRREDVEDLARCISRLVEEEALLRRMSGQAVRRAAAFGFDRYRQLILELYRQLT